MRCPQCGKEIADVTSAQCPSCGMRLTDAELPSAPESGPETLAVNAPAGYAPHPPTPAATSVQPMGKGRIVVMVTLAVIGVLLIGGGSIAAIAAARTVKPAVAVPTATVGATATPTPMATQTSYVVYQNALTKKATGWINGTHCKFENDAYHVFDTYVCFAPTDPLVNVDVSVDVKQVEGGSNGIYGVSFRYPRPTSGTFANNYVFSIDSRGEWVVWKDSNRQVITLTGLTTNPAIHPGQTITNRLRVRTSGQQFDFFVNGTYVGHVDDSRFAGGYVGSEGYVGVTGCTGCDVIFTNIAVSQV